MFDGRPISKCWSAFAAQFPRVNQAKWLWLQNSITQWDKNHPVAALEWSCFNFFVCNCFEQLAFACWLEVTQVAISMVTGQENQSAHCLFIAISHSWNTAWLGLACFSSVAFGTQMTFGPGHFAFTAGKLSAIHFSLFRFIFRHWSINCAQFDTTACTC